MAGNIKIRQYMLHNVTDHVDPLTGEVNNTSLAEDACCHFNDYEGEEGYEKTEIPEKYFECAFEIGEQYEIQTGIKQGSLSKVSGYINSIPGGLL